MLKRIECVPNISEGRRPEVIAALADAVARVPETLLLDRSSDPDHNRTVLTFVGSPEGVKAAVLALYEVALAHIDLRRHAGKHPRIGAVDVVPFIPLRNATLADCVALARETAQAVAVRFGLPVYLYAEAATRPERVSLANLRRGGFEGLATRMADPEGKPDFGPDHPHPAAGASAMGARPFLIAYNLQLDTSDRKIAQAVARTIRASSGGLPQVQAMGVFLENRNQAQVSMNLLDYARTPIHVVQELVKSEAARYGAQVVSSEVVGLIPRAALLEAAAHYLQIENWSPDRVLENAIQRKESERSEGEAGSAAEPLARLPLPEFLQRLAEPTATPGGGGVTALAGALAASLVAMVSGLTAARNRRAESVAPLAEIEAQGRALAAALTRAIDADAQAYNGVLAALRLPKSDPAQRAARTAALQAALKQATEVPRTVANACEEAATLALTALERVRPSAVADAAVALLLAVAGLEGALLNIAANLDSIEESRYVTARQEEIARLTARGNALRSQLWAALRTRIRSLPPA